MDGAGPEVACRLRRGWGRRVVKLGGGRGVAAGDVAVQDPVWNGPVAVCQLTVLYPASGDQ